MGHAMRHFSTYMGGLAAAALMATAAAAAQPIPDPMAALREAPLYDARHPAGLPSAVETVPGVPDPMATAPEPQSPAAGAASVVQAGAPNPELGDLPDGPGAEETYYQCVACHSTALIRQQRITDARWDHLWQWMVEAQGMAEPDEDT